MSTKRRLLAICVSLLTIPAFTMGDAPYNITEISDQAFAISDIERGHSHPKKIKEAEETLKMERNARATTECGTEATETTTETTVTETTTTTAATTTTEATTEETQIPTEAVSEVEVEEQVESTDAVEPYFEEVAFVEETMAETFYDEETAEEETYAEVTGRDEFVWDGKRLNRRDGIVNSWETPSGLKETFYNLPMYGCLDLIGFSRDGYGETEDGFKTYNGYIMVASPDLSRWPKGSYIETTNGMGIVVDFCPAGNLDIAVTW